jgi:OmcA/MtrC family decaheme c-type cytochrome
MRRPSLLATSIAALAALAGACSEPSVGPKPVKETPVTPAAPRIQLAGAAVNADRKLEVSFTLTLGSGSVALADLATLRPTFTLAELTVDPESGLASWKSQLLTGSQTIASNPIGGPGTHPANVLPSQKQTGSDSTGTFEIVAAGAAAALPSGGFRYTFANALPDGYDGTHTYRVGAWLNGATGTEETCGTLDFVPAGGTPSPRDLVADADCQHCHARVLAHGRRVGVRLCKTCHTWQNADPDTVDPAAPLAATAATNPNPLDLGRLVHRIHRGKNLPTLHASSSTAPAPALGTTALPLPFLPGRNAPVNGRKFSIVGFSSREIVYSQVRTWTASGQAPRVVSGGVTFPRDLRDCQVCHGTAPQGDQAYTAISRRTCGGCHPDVWFQTDPVPDSAHFAHPGGPQADDTLCAECHLATATPSPPRKLYVDSRAVHTPILDAERFSAITSSIVSVTNLLPGQKPTVVFTLADREGPISPLNDAANPPPPAGGPSPSPVSRWQAGKTRLAFDLSGPTSPDHSTLNAPLSESVTDPLVADAEGRFTYTFKTVALPDTATGAWSVGLEARRQLSPSSPFYDPATDTFAWPYTGEAITEFANNALVNVDVLTGTTASGPALARRKVVAEEKCLVCHKRLVLHGGNRTNVTLCPVCHTPDQSDWGRRPKMGAGQNVLLAGTLDGLEERSVHFKTLIHRIHTGGRTGVAQIDLEPFVVYGFSGPVFFDEVFPNELNNCRLCHEGESFRLEAIPAGAPSTLANENPTLLHRGTSAHGSSEPRILPMTAACTSCHDTGTARNHADGHVVNGVEGCVGCHGTSGSESVYDLHGLSRPE